VRREKDRGESGCCRFFFAHGENVESMGEGGGGRGRGGGGGGGGVGGAQITKQLLDSTEGNIINRLK